jgi:hypothetical protein
MTKLLRNASRPAITVQETATVEAAVKTILDEKKKVVGMVSLRQVMQERISDLEHEVQVLEAYLGFDGVSG